MVRSAQRNLAFSSTVKRSLAWPRAATFTSSTGWSLADSLWSPRKTSSARRGDASSGPCTRAARWPCARPWPGSRTGRSRARLHRLGDLVAGHLQRETGKAARLAVPWAARLLLAAHLLGHDLVHVVEPVGQEVAHPEADRRQTSSRSVRSGKGPSGSASPGSSWARMLIGRPGHRDRAGVCLAVGVQRRGDGDELLPAGLPRGACACATEAAAAATAPPTAASTIQSQNGAPAVGLVRRPAPGPGPTGRVGPPPGHRDPAGALRARRGGVAGVASDGGSGRRVGGRRLGPVGRPARRAAAAGCRTAGCQEAGVSGKRGFGKRGIRRRVRRARAGRRRGRGAAGARPP